MVASRKKGKKVTSALDSWPQNLITQSFSSALQQNPISFFKKWGLVGLLHGTVLTGKQDSSLRRALPSRSRIRAVGFADL